MKGLIVIMDILIHDLSGEEFRSMFGEAHNDVRIIADTRTIRYCTGCFNCWIKTNVY